MKFIPVIILSLFIAGCATDRGMMPRGTEAGPTPYGYIEMCEDPERRSEIHCPEENDQ